MTPSTPSGRRLADWLDAMRRKQYLGVPMPSEVDAIEAEAGREAVEAYRLSLAEKVRALPEWIEGRRPEDDAECDRIGCEDKTHPMHRAGNDAAAVLRLIEGEKETPPRAR